MYVQTNKQNFTSKGFTQLALTVGTTSCSLCSLYELHVNMSPLKSTSFKELLSSFICIKLLARRALSSTSNLINDELRLNNY